MSSSESQRAELHPRLRELIQYIEMHRRGVHEAVAAVPASLREVKPDSSRWSVAEVVEHLSLIEKRVAMVLTTHVTAARSKGVAPDADTSSVVDSFENAGKLMDRTTKIEAPTHVRPSGTLDPEAGTRALAESHAAMVTALEKANGVSLQNIMQAHPVLGEMNLYHWIVALGLHDARHAAQIREIGESLASG